MFTPFDIIAPDKKGDIESLSPPKSCGTLPQTDIVCLMRLSPVVGAWCERVFMECVDFLPASISAESRPPLDNCVTRRVPPVCVQLERKRRAPRRSLPVPRHRYETTRSRQLCFVQGAQRFGGPPARTCTQRMGPQEDVSRGRRETIARCRLFPEPSRGSPQCQSTAAEF